MEFFIVIGGSLGYLILGSLLSFFFGETGAKITTGGLYGLITYEIVVLGVIGGFLYFRGWTLHQFGLAPNLKDTGIGILLTAAGYLVYLVAFFLTSLLTTDLTKQAEALVAPSLDLYAVVAASVINPFFEELFVCAYVITTVKKSRSDTFALNVSIGIRMAYHLYQGAIGFISIIPFGFIFGYWYLRTGRLWPVIVAHAIFDLIGLLNYVQH
jgi:membrane protease YdiL (CAAX protease family)